MNEMIDTIAGNPDLTAGVIFGLSGMIFLLALAWIIASSIVRGQREREKTRREVAAYVAEGSINPEEAERLLAPRPWWASGVRAGHAPKKRWRQPEWTKDVFGEVVDEEDPRQDRSSAHGA